MVVERTELPSPAPGTRRGLAVHRFGTRGARPEAYLQAGVHADEPPGMVVLAHLVERLAERERRGEVTGGITVVPCANPTAASPRASVATRRAATTCTR